MQGKSDNELIEVKCAIFKVINIKQVNEIDLTLLFSLSVCVSVLCSFNKLLYSAFRLAHTHLSMEQASFRLNYDVNTALSGRQQKAVSLFARAMEIEVGILRLT